MVQGFGREFGERKGGEGYERGESPMNPQFHSGIRGKGPVTILDCNLEACGIAIGRGVVVSMMFTIRSRSFMLEFTGCTVVTVPHSSEMTADIAEPEIASVRHGTV